MADLRVILESFSSAKIFKGGTNPHSPLQSLWTIKQPHTKPSC